VAKDVKRDPELWRRRFILDPMRRIQNAVHRSMLDALAGAGYPPVRIQHLHVFAHVPRDQGMRMSELAERLQLTPGAVTQLVDQLQRLGLIERVPDPSDRRAVRVRPTAAAEAGYEAGRRLLAGREAEWERLVGSRRWATFRAVLSEIADHESGRAGPIGQG
jgi:DNA-binding MarR family transcriptional regulator